MTCENKVSFHVPKGYSTREVFVRCGSTDPWGGRAVCESCYRTRRHEIEAEEAMIEADNAASRSAGWGDW